MKKAQVITALAVLAITPFLQKSHELNRAEQDKYLYPIVHTKQIEIKEESETIRASIQNSFTWPVYEELTTAYEYYDVPFTNDEQEMMQDICSDYGIDYSLLLAIAYVESTWNTEAIGDGGSSIGMYQIQPRWWQGLMDEHQVTDLTDLEQSTTIACAILSQLYEEHTYTAQVLTYYNDGADTEKGRAYKDRVINQLRNLEEK